MTSKSEEVGQGQVDFEFGVRLLVEISNKLPRQQEMELSRGIFT